MTEMIIEVPENWKAFFLDVAEHMKKAPEKYWGEYLVRHMNSAMHDDENWIFGNLQIQLIEKNGLTYGDKND